MVFSNFRNLIRMIKESMKNMTYFLLVLVLVIFMFSLMNLAIDERKFKESLYHGRVYLTGPKRGEMIPRPNIFDTIGTQYQIIFGENPEIPFDDWNNADKVALYVLFTLIVNILMLNLLISIISDVYERVQSFDNSIDMKAKCYLLHETGQIIGYFKYKSCFRRLCCCFKKKEDLDLFYVHRFLYQNTMNNLNLSTNKENNWRGRMKMLTGKMDSVEEEVNNRINQF